MRLLADIRSDPIGAGLAVLLPVLCGLVIFIMLPTAEDTLRDAQRVAKKERIAPPAKWRRTAKRGDVFEPDGLKVAYWGRSDAVYGRLATRDKQPFRAIVLHYTLNLSTVRLIKYQHRGDMRRGGAFGYHFYIDREGYVWQGAPMSVRTNHVKRPGHVRRKPGTHRRIGSHNAIGVSMVGACVTVGHGLGRRCVSESLTQAQKASGKQLIKALQARYGIKCRAVFGHGELQTDRADFEGQTLTNELRADCRQDVAMWH